jgi:alanine dehydrogenase
MTILLSNDEIAGLLDINDVLVALEEAYREAAAGRAILGSRADMVTETPHPDAVYLLKCMGSTIASLGVGAIRINSDILSFPTIDGKQRRRKVPAAPGKRWTGLVLLFSNETGEPLMIFPDGVMQRMRVAGASALGAKYMAREDARRVALIGSGWQAGAQAMAISAVRDVEKICVYSTTRQNREKFCEEMAPQIGVDMQPVETAREAVEGADIVLCATNTQSNVLFQDWLRPGMHISTIRDNEIELAAIKSADAVAMHFSTSMDFDHYISTHGLVIGDQEKEAGNAPEMAYLRDAPTLPDLITGKARGRSSDQDVTCFLNYHGLAIQFAAVGAVLYERAKAKGIGNNLPTDWFTEDVVS